jgi:hypothetical protein
MNIVGLDAKSRSKGTSRAWQYRIVEAARDSSHVSGYTHNFYKYPARFSPKFVRAAIEAFTAPGDLIVDPFMGGGTTLVEALALGRHAIGTDVSSLAVFVTQVKTMLLKDSEIKSLDRWANRVSPRVINMHRPGFNFEEYSENGYYRHLENTMTWRIRKAIEQALASVAQFDSPRLKAFARCAILKTAQWALDGRKTRPDVGEFRWSLTRFVEEMIRGARELRGAIEARSGGPATIRCLQKSAVEISLDPEVAQGAKPKLILTSPPYPGIHVLYHRWQVDGRKETPAPFWIANRLDGLGAAFYSMGDRKAAGLRSYFRQMQNALNSIAALCARDTIVIQVVAFSEPDWQLPKYLRANNVAGLEEICLPLVSNERDGRLWRTVPNRRWHAEQLGETPASQEVVLFHKLSSSNASAQRA